MGCAQHKLSNTQSTEIVSNEHQQQHVTTCEDETAVRENISRIKNFQTHLVKQTNYESQRGPTACISTTFNRNQLQSNNTQFQQIHSQAKQSSIQSSTSSSYNDENYHSVGSRNNSGISINVSRSTSKSTNNSIMGQEIYGSSRQIPNNTSSKQHDPVQDPYGIEPLQERQINRNSLGYQQSLQHHNQLIQNGNQQNSFLKTKNNYTTLNTHGETGKLNNFLDQSSILLFAPEQRSVLIHKSNMNSNQSNQHNIKTSNNSFLVSENSFLGGVGNSGSNNTSGQNGSQNKQKGYEIRMGKPMNQCLEEIFTIQEILQQQFFPQAKATGSPLALFSDEITIIYQKWVGKVLGQIIKETGEIRNFIGIRASCEYLKVFHEIANLKDYAAMLQEFCEDLDLSINRQHLQKCKRNLTATKAMTQTIYIEFYLVNQQLEVNVGVSGTQPYEESDLTQFIINDKQKDNLIQWYREAMPIATQYCHIINSMFKDQIFTFYLFENDEQLNLLKALQAFQNYGADINPIFLNKVQQAITISQLWVIFHLTDLGLLSVKIQFNSFQNPKAEESMFDDFKYTPFVKNAWKRLNQNVFSKSGNTFSQIQFTPEGFHINQFAEIDAEYLPTVPKTNQNLNINNNIPENSSQIPHANNHTVSNTTPSNINQNQQTHYK